MKLFIVDDEEPNREFIQCVLESMFPGAEIMQAVNGLEARDKITELADTSAVLPDIIFSDYQMPGLNGLELLRFVKSHPLLKEVNFILSSGILNPQHLEAEIIVHDKASFMAKPFLATELQQLVLEVLAANKKNKK